MEVYSSNIAACKRKSADGTHQHQSDCVKPKGIVKNGVIAVHKYNSMLFAECMAASENNFIQAPLPNRCSIRKMYTEGSWQGFDYIDLCKHSLRSTMQWHSQKTFLSLEHVTLLARLLHGFHKVWFDSICEIINDTDKTAKVGEMLPNLSNLEGLKEICKIFHRRKEEIDDFMAMDSPPIVATDAHGNEEPLFLSCYCET